VPLPPEGALEPELTKAAATRADAEMKAALKVLDGDPSIPADQKREIKAKITRFKIAVFTTAKSFDDTVLFYQKEIVGAQFLIGERDVLGDLQELAATTGIVVPQEAVRDWSGKRGRSARWSRQDKSLEIDIEDTLIDPRDGKISKKTVVLVTSVD
jgi:hypothetical protein